MESRLPDKKYFRIGEVARLTSIKASVLRFWETEFKELRPPKSRTGQRLYTRQDIELLLEIKRLLYEEKLTIEGARRKLRGKVEVDGDPRLDGHHEKYLLGILKEVKHDLEALLGMLSRQN